MTRKTSTSKSRTTSSKTSVGKKETTAWSIKGDQIILTKIKDTGSTKEEPTIADYDWYTVKEEAINEYLNSESEGKEYKDFDEQYGVPLRTLARSARILE